MWTPAGGRTAHRAGTWRAEGPSRGLSGVRRGPERRWRRGRGGRPRSRRRGAGSSAPPVAKPAETPPPSAGSPPRSVNRARNADGARLARGRSAAASLYALGGARGTQRRRPTAAASAPRKGRLSAVTLRVPEDGSFARRVPGGGGGVPRSDLVAVGTRAATPWRRLVGRDAGAPVALLTNVRGSVAS